MLPKDYLDQVIEVTKKSRSKFFVPAAIEGDVGIVKNAWVNDYGTIKIVIITNDGSQRATTSSCIKFKSEPLDLEFWKALKAKVELEESIPVLAKCLNAGPKAFRFETIQGKKIIFVNRADKINDITEFKVNKVSTVNLPIWIAKKTNIL